MRRWHQERSLMLRRWENEKRKHQWDDRLWGGAQDSFERCHCSAGPGLMRKARPWDRRSHDLRWYYSFHRQEVAHSNKERRRQDQQEIAARLQDD